jgi:hypothetical protein
MAMTTRKPPWQQPNPRKGKPPRPLSDAQKAAAKQRAEAAGRRYPNLVDNLWAARLPRD